jgi:hypothetical protein
MYSWINNKGETIRTKTIKEFAQMAGLRESNARSLACGCIKRLKGWLSTHPSARKYRKRWRTVLVNSKDGTRQNIGQTVSGFARAHNLCKNELYKLINGRKFMYRHWCLETTLQLAHSKIADAHF